LGIHSVANLSLHRKSSVLPGLHEASQKKSYVEPTSNGEGISYEEFAQDIPEDLALAVKLVSNLSGAATDMEGYDYDYGAEHDWTQCQIEVPNMETHTISKWLPEQVCKF
jgi:hypothetical protein